MTVLKSLEAYAARVGAEKLSFRKFMVKEYAGSYYSETAYIYLDTKTGEVRCTNSDYAPTEEEFKKIKEEAAKVEWPRSVVVSRRSAEDQAKKLQGIAYLFPARPKRGEKNKKGQDIVMLQQRFLAPDGTKVFVPWAFFNTDGWQPLEPDGNLPFWKPEKPRGKDRIMIHEGAKAAMAADAIANDKDSGHPWAKEMALFEHWGMIGGALAPHRSDYGELENEKPSEVVYICDNDLPGMGVLKEVSRRYAGTLKGVFFDPRWKGAWDMAEDMPRSLFGNDSEGREMWVGQSLRSLMKPATHATKLIPNPRGKPTPILNPHFAEEWVHAVTPEVYIHKDRPNDMMSEDEFNNYIRPYSDTPNTAALVRQEDSTKARLVKYDPTVGPGLYRSADDERYFNTYVGPNIKGVKGDCGPWTEFMEHLFPIEEDRIEVYRWCCTLVMHPEIKMRYGILLQSVTQGVGKGTLGEKILSPLVGRLNVSEPSERTITDSAYNDWVAHKRLAVCHEIYAGHSSKAYNNLKSVISEDNIEVHKKFLAAYPVQNWVHIIACSNSTKALQLTLDDRRWLTPKVREEKRSVAYWTGLNRWLTEQGGIAMIKWWMEDWLTKNDAVIRGAEAPWTANKREVIEEGYSPGMTLVSSFLRALKEEKPDEDLIILDVHLVEAIKNVVYEGRQTDYLEKPATVRKIASSMGYWISEHNIPYGVKWGQGATARSRMILTKEAELSKRPEVLAKVGRRPIDVMELMRQWGLAGKM